MGLNEVGSAADILASIGVMVSLFYLGKQIHDSRVSARVEAQNESQGSGRPADLLVAQDPAVAALFIRGLTEYGSLDLVEICQFEFLLSNVMQPAMLVARHAEAGLVGEEEIAVALAMIRRFLSMPGGESWFKHNMDMMPAAFCRMVLREMDQIRKSAPSSDI
jgi:hypothetical protein